MLELTIKVTKEGVGKHIEVVAASNPHGLAVMLQALTPGEMFYTLSICFSKFSILAIYWRIFGINPVIKKVIIVVGCIVSGWTISVVRIRSLDLDKSTAKPEIVLGSHEWCGLCPTGKTVETSPPRTLYQSHQVLFDYILPERYHGLVYAYYTFAAYMESKDAQQRENPGDRSSLHGQFVSVDPVQSSVFTNIHECLCRVNNSFSYYVQRRPCRLHLGADQSYYLDDGGNQQVHSQQTNILAVNI